MTRTSRGLLTIVFGLAWGCGSSAGVPEAMLGIWRHPDEAYADRTLEIRSDLLVFHVGDGAEIFPITDVSVERRGEETVCTVEYRLADGSLVPLRMVYTPRPEPQLRLGAREGIWRPVAQTAGADLEATS